MGFPTEPIDPKDAGNFDKVYKIGKVLGEGAFAKVYVCTRKDQPKETAEPRAVKLINKNFLMPGSKDQMAFDVELQINRRLKHENVVNLLEDFSEPKLALVFDLCKGGDLFNDIEEKETYTEYDAANCFYQVLQGSAYIHSQGIIHRDLKPENLLIYNQKVKMSKKFKKKKKKGKQESIAGEEKIPTSLIKIGDFGLAVDVSASDGWCSTPVGTPGFICPEISNSTKENKIKYDYRADSWSNGSILFCLLGGYYCFADDAEEKAGKVEFEAAYWKNISQQAKNVILKLMTFNIQNRPTCEAMLEDEWFDICDSEIKHESLTGTMDAIKAFNAKRKFKTRTRAIMASNKIAKIGLLAKLKKAQSEAEPAGEAPSEAPPKIEEVVEVKAEKTVEVEKVVVVETPKVEIVSEVKVANDPIEVVDKAPKKRSGGFGCCRKRMNSE